MAVGALTMIREPSVGGLRLTRLRTPCVTANRVSTEPSDVGDVGGVPDQRLEPARAAWVGGPRACGTPDARMHEKLHTGAQRRPRRRSWRVWRELF